MNLAHSVREILHSKPGRELWAITVMNFDDFQKNFIHSL